MTLHPNAGHGAEARTPKQVLEAAKARIDKPQKWMRGRLSNERGRFCALGAIEVVSPTRDLEDEALYAIGDVLQDDLATFNDTRTHAAVMAMFDRAIEVARS